MAPEDIGEIRRILLILSMRTGGGLDFFYSLPFLETVEIAGEIYNLMKEKAENGRKNRQ